MNHTEEVIKERKEELKLNLGLRPPCSDLESLFQNLVILAGNGNTSFIMSAAKKNPNCRIIFGLKSLADIYRSEYIREFKENHNGRKPHKTEMPEFLHIGKLNRLEKSLSKPIIVDNSCLSLENLAKHSEVIYEKGRDVGIKVAEIAKEKIKFKVKQDIIKLIKNMWYMPFKKLVIQQITNL